MLWIPPPHLSGAQYRIDPQEKRTSLCKRRHKSLHCAKHIADSLQAMFVPTDLTLVFRTQRVKASWFRTIERALGRLGRRRWLAVTLVGMLALVASATLSLLGRIPEPHVHDEFSYLLAADTFVHGRLTNPTHPLWVHFESFHIIHQPTYASKYPPAQGLVLATGQLLGGHPIVGVWIGTALACAAICWMLLAWLPRWWAVLGGLLAALHPLMLSHWSQNYWGGAVAVIGGALVFGALRRIMRRPRVRDALLLGLGLAVLANSRPYEGLLISLPAAVLLLVWMMGKNGPATHVSITRIVLPIGGVVVLTGGMMAFYNWRVTGDPLRMPYQIHEATYAIAPSFLWQSPRPKPSYRHKAMGDMWRDMNFREYIARRSDARLWLLSSWSHSKLTVLPYPLVLLVPLVVLAWILRDRWSRFALLACGTLTAGLILSTFFFTHYAAPMTALMFAVILQAMRQLRLWRWRGSQTGRLTVWTILIICVASFLLAFAQQVRTSWSAQMLPRARILAQLKETNGRHLVVVRYGPGHSAEKEWVYNEADIDGAKVVWAREMDSVQNRKLLGYFKDRQVWLLEVGQDGSSPELKPYPVASPS
jgi:hypothetical protein